MRQFVEMFIAMSGAVAFAEEGEFLTAMSFLENTALKIRAATKLSSRKKNQATARKNSFRA